MVGVAGKPPDYRQGEQGRKKDALDLAARYGRATF